MRIFDWNKIEFKQARPGVWYKTLRAKNMQMFYFKLEFGETSNHSHPEEQMGYVLAGQAELTVGTEKKICKAGNAYYIPSNVQHGFKVLSFECFEWIEVFSPPKEEHNQL